MSHFTVYNAAGKILRSGQCPEEYIAHQAGDGEFVIAEQSDPERDTVDPVSGSVVPGGLPPPPVDMDYRRARLEAYPDVRDQLDMLWHAMDQQPDLRIEPFYSAIKLVKDSYPKDNSVVPGSVVVYTVEA